MQRPVAHTFRVPLLLPLVILLLTGCVTVPTRVMIGAGNQAPFHADFQQWYLLDDRTPVHEMLGRINEISIFRGVPFADGDWNIHVTPLQPFQSMLVNRSGIVNSDRVIEFEIRSAWPENGLDLKQAFPAGTIVRAAGFWVEDGGHQRKTELHPLIMMETAPTGSADGGPATTSESSVSNDFTIFVGQDLSGRFAVARSPLSYSFPVPLHPVAKVRNISTGAVGPGTNVAVKEEASGSPPAQATIGAEGAEVHVSLPAATGRVGSSGPFPYYLGHFTGVVSPAISDSVVVAYVHTADGLPYLEITVSARLDALESGQPYREVVWHAPDGDTSGSTVTQTFRYAPSLGDTRSEWPLDVVARTDYSGAHTRIFVAGGVRYRVTPSSATLSQSRDGNGVTVSAQLHPVHPSVTITSAWLVSADGENSSAAPVVVAAGEPLSGDGFQASVDSAGRLQVRFESAHSRALVVSYVGESDLGEPVVASTRLLPVDTGQ